MYVPRLPTPALRDIFVFLLSQSGDGSTKYQGNIHIFSNRNITQELGYAACQRNHTDAYPPNYDATLSEDINAFALCRNPERRSATPLLFVAGVKQSFIFKVFTDQMVLFSTEWTVLCHHSIPLFIRIFYGYFSYLLCPHRGIPEIYSPNNSSAHSSTNKCPPSGSQSGFRAPNFFVCAVFLLHTISLTSLVFSGPAMHSAMKWNSNQSHSRFLQHIYRFCVFCRLAH